MLHRRPNSLIAQESGLIAQECGLIAQECGLISATGGTKYGYYRLNMDNKSVKVFQKFKKGQILNYMEIST